MDMLISSKKFLTIVSNSFYKCRDWLWSYPDFVVNFIKKGLPFTFFLIAGLIIVPVTWLLFDSEKFIYSSQDQVLYEAYLNPMTRDPSTGEFSKLIINPLIDTNNQVEKDIEKLVYSPLFTVDDEGKLTYYLAQGYIINQAQTEYTFTLRSDVYWYQVDKSETAVPFTADDVIFTFSRYSKIKEQNIKVSKVDDYRVKFVLPSSSPVFLETISIGIVPEHIWKDIRGGDNIALSVFNQYPIGTGPFFVEKHETDLVVLKRNENYFGVNPKLEEIHFRLFSSEYDLIKEIRRKKVHSVVNPTDEILKVLNEEYPYFERQLITLDHNVKMVFINSMATVEIDGESKPSVLVEPELRRILSMLIDREELITYVGEHGFPAYGPIPVTSWAFGDGLEYFKFDLDKAKDTLSSLGWNLDGESGYRKKKDVTFMITITYLDNAENQEIVSFLKESFAQGGILLVEDPQSFQQIASETIQTRDFEMLLFEVELGRDPDPYTLWHSTQMEHPGYNLSQYASTQVDVRLERGRQTMDKDVRKQLYKEMVDFLMYDMPALYLYHPTVEYYIDNKVKGVDILLSTRLDERFDTISRWYISDR